MVVRNCSFALNAIFIAAQEETSNALTDQSKLYTYRYGVGLEHIRWLGSSSVRAVKDHSRVLELFRSVTDWTSGSYQTHILYRLSSLANQYWVLTTDLLHEVNSFEAWRRVCRRFKCKNHCWHHMFNGRHLTHYNVTWSPICHAMIFCLENLKQFIIDSWDICTNRYFKSITTYCSCMNWVFLYFIDGRHL